MTPAETQRRIDLARAAECLQTAITWAEEAGRVDLSNAVFDLHNRFEAAIDAPDLVDLPATDRRSFTAALRAVFDESERAVRVLARTAPHKRAARKRGGR